MSTELAEAAAKVVQIGSLPDQVTHALHIKNVPYEVWCRARHNANLSGVTYRDFVIRLLAESHPFPQQGDLVTTK